jgi:hypothetical protein
MRAIQQMGEDAAGRSAAQYNASNQAQEMRQRQHEDSMASMQRGTDMSMQRTGQGMNARSRAGDDCCDYSLGLQKRLDRQHQRQFEGQGNRQLDAARKRPLDGHFSHPVIISCLLSPHVGQRGRVHVG